MEKIVITENDSGKCCSVCARPFRTGEYVVLCEECDSLTHESCYREHGCGNEDCRIKSGHFEKSDIILTKEEVSNVIAIPGHIKNPTKYIISELNKEKKPFSKMAIFSLFFSDLILTASVVSFVCSKLIFNTSLTLFYSISILGGFLSIFLSIISLSLFNKNKKLRGLPIALCALVSGIIPVLGSFSYSFYNAYNYKEVITKKEEKLNIAETIEKSSPKIQLQMKSNVRIKSGFGFNESLGSGVVAQNKDSKTYIITNVHVLTGGSMVDSLDEAKKKTSNLKVTFYTGETKDADILWVAPSGIDLALISCQTPKDYNCSVKIGSSNEIKMGEKVFAIGNPMGLDWTYTEGVVSSFRNKQIGQHEISVIQIQTPLNHGNSGGGLYSENGNLVGINTWIYEKAKSEGLNFSISIDELIKTLNPDLLKLITE